MKEKNNNKKIKISFFGGTEEVTGSNYLLEIDGDDGPPRLSPRSEAGGEAGPPGIGEAGKTRILVDCGLFQGSRVAEEKNSESFPYKPSSIDALLVTHAHLDHVGRIPRLVKEGFKGKIYSTYPTKDFAKLMLIDSMGVLSKEAKRHGDTHPIYQEEDVEKAMSLWEAKNYRESFEIGGVNVLFKDAGHILGSAIVEIANSENPPSEVLVPEFVQVNEMKNAIKDQLGMTLPFEVGEQSADKAVEKDQLSVNVLVGKQSSTVEIFGPDSKVVQREGSNIIQGNIFDFTDNDNDGQKEISPLPASGAGGSQEVVAVNGCSPDAVSVSMGKVTAIYDETAKQWIKSTSDETPSLTPTPEGVELRGDTLVKIDKDSGKILEYVDPKTGEWTSASFEFTKTITLGFKENYVANVEGMEIPIGLGLEHWVTKRSEQQIKEVHIAPDIVDILGDIFMHACFLRYTNLMGNNVTYEEYVELVKQGKGQVEIAAFDEITGNNEELPKLMQVDPREGFALTLSEQKQPVVYNKDLWSFYVGVDGRGRFLVTDDLFTTKYLNTYDPMTEKYSGELVDSIILRDQFNKPLIIMADIDNRCMLGGNMRGAEAILFFQSYGKKYFCLNLIFTSSQDVSCFFKMTAVDRLL